MPKEQPYPERPRSASSKPIRFVCTAGFKRRVPELFILSVTRLIATLFHHFPVDMFVFERCGERQMQVRLAGYDFHTGTLDETTIVHKLDAADTATFWCKIDDYGEHYVATFLFPEEY